MVRLLFFFMLCVVLKKCFGWCRVLVFILLVSILFEFGIMLLQVWVRWVIELSRIIIFFLCLIRCLVCLMIIFVICMWCVVGLLKVELMILLCMVCCILVIFFGCLLISSMIRCMFGWLVVMVVVICCIIIVLLVFGCDMMSECWFLFCGVIRLRMWLVMFFDELLLCFRVKWWCGNSVVRFLNSILFFDVLIGLLLMVLMMFSVKQCLLFFGKWM